MPADQVAECVALMTSMKASEPPAVAQMRAAFGPRSPLPEIAEAFYTMGGCWNLALAINAKTQLPIELYYQGGRPTHAYVVDGQDDSAIDARGRNPVRLARLGAERTRTVTPDELFEVLEVEVPNGTVVVSVVRRSDWVSAADETAAVVLAAVG